MNKLTSLYLARRHHAQGQVQLPGSKSISNRTLLLAALAHGSTRVSHLLDADDTRVMLAALKTLGIQIEVFNKNEVLVQGCGGVFPVPQAQLFLGNAGTAFRPLSAALVASAAHNQGQYELSGVPRMHERPIGDLVDGLRQLGADIRYLNKDAYPPLQITGAALQAGCVQVRGDTSSQFLTALLLMAPLVARQQQVTIDIVGDLISKPYVEITLNLMARFGVQVQRQQWQQFVVSAGQTYQAPGVVRVEGDASSASYFLAAGTISGGPVRVIGAGRNSIQGDVKFADALERMGAHITWGDDWIEASAPQTLKTQDLKTQAFHPPGLKALDLDCNAIPDAAMTLAMCALFADGTTTLRNIASWRVKETDRIAAMATELRKLGAQVGEGADFIRITPPQRWQPNAEIATYDDHRMAMCFSLASFAVPVTILEPECVAKTFSEYFDVFAGLFAPSVISEVTTPMATATVSATQPFIPLITIDGPTASGKGTVAARVAAALGFHLLDSGALYRLTALAAQRAGVALDDEAQLAALASQLKAVFTDEPRVTLDNEDVTDLIRAEVIGNAASKIAAFPEVREALLERQRAFQHAPGLVADGRDMGTVVFPNADLKVYLTASVQARAERRYKQLIEKGFAANLRALSADLHDRDARDMNRRAAPLKPAEGAQQLDTSRLTIDEVVAQVLAWWAQVKH